MQTKGSVNRQGGIVKNLEMLLVCKLNPREPHGGPSVVFDKFCHNLANTQRSKGEG